MQPRPRARLQPTQAVRVEYILGQLFGRTMPPSPFRTPDGRADLTLPELTSFQREFLEELLDPQGAALTSVWGGIGCGKTIALAVAAFVVAMTRPGSVSLMSSDTYTNMMAITWKTCSAVFQGAATWVGAPKAEWRFPNDSVIQLRAYRLPKTQDEAQNPWEGRTVTGLLLVDEVQKLPSKHLVKHASQRTRGQSFDLTGAAHPPKVVLNGRPGAIDWWPKAVAAAGGRLFDPKTRDNPHNGPDYIPGLKATMSLREFLCLTEGSPMPVEGALYDGFRDIREDDGGTAYWPEGNLLPTGIADGPGPIYCAIDPGFGSPAALFIRPARLRHPDLGREITCHVILGGVSLDEVTTPQLIQAIHAACDARDWWIQATICDPAGLARNAQTSESDVGLLERPRDYDGDHLGGGLGAPVYTPTDPAKRDVLTGVGRVQALICNAASPPMRRLLIVEDHWRACEAVGSEERNIRNSILQYTRGIAARKRRVGADHDSTHHADALRYYVAEGPGTWSGAIALVKTPPRTPDPVETAHGAFVHGDR